MRTLTFTFLSVAISDVARAQPAQNHLALEVVQTFSYDDVKLTDGQMADQAQLARDFYLALSEDNLLNGFRKRGGQPAPGKPMGGWYDPDGFAGAHPFGQYVSALARMYAVTGDARFKDKVARLVHGFHATFGPDGFFYSSAKVAKEWPCYLYDKNCIGMRDAYTLTGCQEALTVLREMTDWAVKNLPRRSDEWYTLPENLYNCYALTKDHRYWDMAQTYDYSREYYEPFANGTNAFTPERHAYSHVNTLCSAAKAYEATGQGKYFRAISNAWEFLTGTQMYASGGWGPTERFVNPGHGELAASLEKTGNHFETPCGTYANVNLDRYLLRFTGNAKYGDNMERVLLNGMLATLPPQPDGKTFYYSDYRPGTQKQYFGDAWPCCSGTYAQITADYPLDIYFHNDKALYVNLFAPSQVRWQHRGNQVTLEQTTQFPRSDTISLTVHTKARERFPLNVRVPSWAGKPLQLSVNGKFVSPPAPVGGFLPISRTWREGDVLTVTFPMSLRFEPVDAETPGCVALMYGPLLLVAVADGPVHLQGNPMKPEEWIKPRKDDPLAFETEDGRVVFRPFYLVTNERYTTYCQLSSAPKSTRQ